MGTGNESFVNTNDDAGSESITFSQEEWLGAFSECGLILDLPELDRFVFVICVLERYSVYDCALLLGRPPQDINEARRRVGNQSLPFIDLSNV
jgi:hypothetical protein